MDAQKDVLEQQALVLEAENVPDEGVPEPESKAGNLHELFERLNDQPDQDGPDINEQMYLAEAEFDPQAYSDYAAMQAAAARGDVRMEGNVSASRLEQSRERLQTAESALQQQEQGPQPSESQSEPDVAEDTHSAMHEEVARGEPGTESELSASQLTNEIQHQQEAVDNALNVVHMLESQRDNYSADLSEPDIAELQSQIQDATSRLEQSRERLQAAESALLQLEQDLRPTSPESENAADAGDDSPEQDLTLHRFVMSGLTGKSWEVQSPDIGDVFRQFASSRAAVLKLLKDDDETWLVSGEYLDEGNTWQSHYHSPAVEELAKAAQRLTAGDSEQLSPDTLRQNSEAYATARLTVEQELGLTQPPEPAITIEQDGGEQPEITNGLEFLESGGSLSSYVQRYRDALAAESGRQLLAAQQATGNDRVADHRLANTNPRELERNSQNSQKEQQSQGAGVAGPTVGALLGAVAARGVQGLSKLANSLSMAGGSVAQSIASHSYQRTERALSAVMSQSEQDIALLQGMGLQDIADADAGDKSSLRTAFMAKDGVQPLVAKLGSNIDQAEALASSLIKKGQASGIEPDRVMRDSLGTVGDFAKRHKLLLDEINDRNGKSFSERLEGITTGLLTYLKSLAMALANRLNMNAGAPAAAGPRMG